MRTYSLYNVNFAFVMSKDIFGSGVSCIIYRISDLIQKEYLSKDDLYILIQDKKALSDIVKRYKYITNLYIDCSDKKFDIDLKNIYVTNLFIVNHPGKRMKVRHYTNIENVYGFDSSLQLINKAINPLPDFILESYNFDNGLVSPKRFHTDIKYVDINNNKLDIGWMEGLRITDDLFNKYPNIGGIYHTVFLYTRDSI